MGRTSTRSTPVPKFEWMEDEHFIKRSIKLVGASGTIGGSAIGSGKVDGGAGFAQAMEKFGLGWASNNPMAQNKQNNF